MTTRFNAAEHAQELIPLAQFIDHPLNRHGIIPDKRHVYYQIHENPDRSFIDYQAAVQVGARWFIWPTGLVRWVDEQANRTLRNCAQ